LSDGTQRAEIGIFKLYKEVLILTVKGWYSFISDDGREYMVNFTGNLKNLPVIFLVGILLLISFYKLPN
jgi:hypothetical protein